MIAMILANKLFVYNNITGDIEKIYEAYDCEEMCSLSWNETGD